MELQEPNLQSLFAQLGEADDEAAIARFIEKNACQTAHIKLHEAAFWSTSQATFLREAIHQDANWAAVVDQLSAMLEHAYQSRG